MVHCRTGSPSGRFQPVLKYHCSPFVDEYRSISAAFSLGSSAARLHRHNRRELAAAPEHGTPVTGTSILPSQ